MPEARIKRTVSVSMDKDLAEAVYNYCKSEEIVAPGEGIRQLLRIALASAPEDGLISAVKNRAFNEVRIWTLSQVSIAIHEIHELLKASQAEAVKLAAPQDPQ